MSPKPPADPRLVFVYGTLRPEHPGDMAAWLRQRSVSLGKGTIAGVLRNLGRYPAATIGQGQIVGELVKLTKNPYLEVLDSYEGQGYQKYATKVTMDESNVELMAWVYWATRDLSAYPVIASGDWLARGKE